MPSWMRMDLADEKYWVCPALTSQAASALEAEWRQGMSRLEAYAERVSTAAGV